MSKICQITGKKAQRGCNVSLQQEVLLCRGELLDFAQD